MSLYKVIILAFLYLIKCILYFKYILNKLVKCNVNSLLTIFMILFEI